MADAASAFDIFGFAANPLSLAMDRVDRVPFWFRGFQAFRECEGPARWSPEDQRGEQIESPKGVRHLVALDVAYARPHDEEQHNQRPDVAEAPQYPRCSSSSSRFHPTPAAPGVGLVRCDLDTMVHRRLETLTGRFPC